VVSGCIGSPLLADSIKVSISTGVVCVVTPVYKTVPLALAMLKTAPAIGVSVASPVATLIRYTVTGAPTMGPVAVVPLTVAEALLRVIPISMVCPPEPAGARPMSTRPVGRP
jgi:hypothetical protein